TARREQAHTLHVEILRALSAKLEGEEALQAARRLVELEPADEAAHRLVMSLLGKLGRPREAVAQYDALREILRSTFGQSPSAETERLRMSLGTPAPAPAAIAAPTPRFDPPRKATP